MRSTATRLMWSPVPADIITAFKWYLSDADEPDLDVAIYHRSARTKSGSFF